jgi:hypothetical protein
MCCCFGCFCLVVVVWFFAYRVTAAGWFGGCSFCGFFCGFCVVCWLSAVVCYPEGGELASA